MPKIKNLVAEETAPTLRRNPEIDARLDQFIQANPRLLKYYEGFSKEELIRKHMLGKMEQQGYRVNRNETLKAWVEANPEIKDRVEAKIRHVPAEQREQAFLNVARKEAENQGIKPNGTRQSVS